MLVTILAVVAHRRPCRKKGVRGAVLWGILGGAVLYYRARPDRSRLLCQRPSASTLKIDFVGAFRDFGEHVLRQGLHGRLRFLRLCQRPRHGRPWSSCFITTSLAFCMVDMFDTLGTLLRRLRPRQHAAAKNGEVPNMDKRHAGRRHRHHHRRCLRHLHRHDVRRVLRRCCRGRPNRPCLYGRLLRCSSSPCSSAPSPRSSRRLRHRCGPHLCRRSDDATASRTSTGRIRPLLVPGVPHDGDDALHLQHLLRHRVRPDLLCAHPYLHRQDPSEVKVGTWVITILFLLMLFLTH